MSEVLEVVRFSVKPEEREAFLAERDGAIEALRDQFPGLLGATLAEYEDGTWLDVLTWASAEEAEAAATAIESVEPLARWASHIDEVVEFVHPAVRHRV